MPRSRHLSWRGWYLLALYSYLLLQYFGVVSFQNLTAINVKTWIFFLLTFPVSVVTIPLAAVFPGMSLGIFYFFFPLANVLVLDRMLRYSTARTDSGLP